ncbi:type II secretion system F family protein [Lichenibacterium dinghuense]|uniref:type II secretion system F family protein n=1 Tax=Lichenibacterium dinghuense TaxID=2895977 RepID=UPI0021083010
MAYGLGIAAVGCALFVASPYLTGDIKAEKRRAAVATPRAKRIGAERVVDAASRRKQVADSLKEVESRGKARKASLEIRIQRAGLEWSRKTYVTVSATLGVLLGLVLLAVQDSWAVAAAAALVGGFGLPSWILGYLKKRRLAKFSAEFPNAIDVVIRGVKAGLPLGDCLRVIAGESPEPLRSEFRRVVESQAMGLGIGEAVERMAERVPITETNFFAIVIAIQAKAGGNLTEALGNLSRVVRDRKKMKAKVKAISSEAKASAGIIGSLPFIVGTLVWLMSPDYIALLWTTSTGRMMLAAGLFWMSIGVFVMKNMINFEI